MSMSISSIQLDAFIAVSKHGGFSVAAKVLGITQSALSQRILNLEKDLEASLIIRESTGIRLTELGQKLLRYCQSKEHLEEEFLVTLKAKSVKDISGIVRIGGFSTITQSVLIPILANITKDFPNVQIEVTSEELRDLPSMLASGQVDFIFLTKPLDKQGVKNHLVGYEENVLIQPNSKKFRADVFLDHDQDDTTTFDFFKLQGKKIPYLKRNYLDEIYTIVEGVKHGMGRAVVPIHIANTVKGVEVVPGYKSLQV